MEDFLCTRVQRVRVGSDFSAPASVASGIPQGTVLGPLFYISFINDVQDVIIHSNLTLYADYSKIISEINSVTDC